MAWVDICGLGRDWMWQMSWIVQSQRKVCLQKILYCYVIVILHMEHTPALRGIEGSCGAYAHPFQGLFHPKNASILFSVRIG